MTTIQKTDRAMYTVLAFAFVILFSLMLSGFLATGSIAHPLPKGGEASIGFTHELPEKKGLAK